MPKSSTPKRKRDLASVYEELAGLTKRGRLMHEVERFTAVPTIFPGFNRASRIGGAPLSCVWTLQGPPRGGKSAFVVGLLRSFQRIGAICAFIDAEMAASTHDWFRMLGVDQGRCIYIGRSDQSKLTRPPPLTYEETVDECDRLLDGYQAMKAKRTLPHGTPLIICVDSLTKLVPAATLKKIEKDGGDALSSGVGRLQAMLNSSWLLSLGPRVGDDDVLFLVIVHESETKHANWTEVRHRGGARIEFDSMMMLRCVFAGQVTDHAKEGSPFVGKKHRVKILKNKHGPDNGEFYFYTSNGDGSAPLGFDRPRELLHEAAIRGLIEKPNKEHKFTLGSEFLLDGARYTLKDLYDEGGEPLLTALEDLLEKPHEDENAVEIAVPAERPSRAAKKG